MAIMGTGGGGNSAAGALYLDYAMICPLCEEEIGNQDCAALHLVIRHGDELTNTRLPHKTRTIHCVCGWFINLSEGRSEGSDEVSARWLASHFSFHRLEKDYDLYKHILEKL